MNLALSIDADAADKSGRDRETLPGSATGRHRHLYRETLTGKPDVCRRGTRRVSMCEISCVLVHFENLLSETIDAFRQTQKQKNLIRMYSCTGRTVSDLQARSIHDAPPAHAL